MALGCKIVLHANASWAPLRDAEPRRRRPAKEPTCDMLPACCCCLASSVSACCPAPRARTISHCPASTATARPMPQPDRALPGRRHAAGAQGGGAAGTRGDRTQDWAAAAAAWEARIAAGDATPAQWLALAEAQLRRTPPEPAHALQAAWQNFSSADAGRRGDAAAAAHGRGAAALDRPPQAIQALDAAADARPTTPTIAARWTSRGKPPASWCAASPPNRRPIRRAPASTSPSRRSAATISMPQDWVRLDPPVQGAAVTREGDQICVSGLPSGATTRILLRAGMPGEAGLSLRQGHQRSPSPWPTAARASTSTRACSCCRAARRRRSALTTVNLVHRHADTRAPDRAQRGRRSCATPARASRSIPGMPTDQRAERRVVWQGSADIPNWQPNRSAHTALPLPDALAASGPGLYALIARAGDGTPRRADRRADDPAHRSSRRPSGAAPTG